MAQVGKDLDRQYRRTNSGHTGEQATSLRGYKWAKETASTEVQAGQWWTALWMPAVAANQSISHQHGQRWGAKRMGRRTGSLCLGHGLYFIFLIFIF